LHGTFSPVLIGNGRLKDLRTIISEHGSRFKEQSSNPLQEIEKNGGRKKRGI
jgi:hypothetical protein